MKKQSIWIFLFLTSIWAISGCIQANPQSSPETSPENADLKNAAPENAAIEESQLPATYFYLESRIHDQRDEIPQAIASLEKAIEKDPDSTF